jgi:hypothetical protein
MANWNERILMILSWALDLKIHVIDIFLQLVIKQLCLQKRIVNCT